MPTLSVEDLVKKTTYTIFESKKTPLSQRYSVGLAIYWKVPGFHPIENIFHVHLDMIKRNDSSEICIANNTPPQMISYKFWRWLESSTTSDFIYYYLSRMYEIIHTGKPTILAH